MRARFLSLFFVLPFTLSCKMQAPMGSSLAYVESSEVGWSNTLCRKNVGATRVSRVKTSSFEMVFLAQDYCGAAGKRNGLSLVEPRASKPVLITYGFGGNSEYDGLIHDAMNDTKPWANENFRVVNIPTGSDLGTASQIINNDRLRNPNDYGPNSWVGTIVASHGGVGYDGRHKLVKSDVSDTRVVPNQIGPTSTSTAYNTVDVQKALLGAVGDKAGTVVCTVYGCQSGAAKSDPEFESITTNPRNPSQKRIFQFSSSAEHSASSSPTIDSNGQNAMGASIEQSVGFLMQQAEDDGLTVGEYQNKLKQANLGNFEGFDVTTTYVPNNGSIMDTGVPAEREAYNIVTPLFSVQGASVVGPNDAYILPPGVKPDSYNPPIAGTKEQIDAEVNQLPPGTGVNLPQEIPQDSLYQ